MKLDTFRRLDDHQRRIRQLERTEPDAGDGGGGGPVDWSDITNKPSLAYVHTQGTASATWTINHSLTFVPNATVVDSAGNQVEGTVVYVDGDTLTISFSAAFSGTAYLS